MLEFYIRLKSTIYEYGTPKDLYKLIHQIGYLMDRHSAKQKGE